MNQTMQLRELAAQQREKGRIAHSGSLLLAVTAAVLAIPRTPNVGIRAASNLIRFSRSAITREQAASVAVMGLASLGCERFRTWHQQQAISYDSQAHELASERQNRNQP